MPMNTTSEVELLGVIDLESNQEESASEGTQTIMFRKRREFLLLRWLLRGLSLWYPKSSSCVSRYFYPGIISLLLASNALCYVLIGVLKKDVDITYNILAVIITTGGFFSHLTASFYFRSRDLEDNMMCIYLDESHLKKFQKSLKYLNVRIVISIAVFIYFIYGLIVAITNDSRVPTTFLVNNVYPYDDVYRQALLCLVTAGHIYMLGLYIAIVWIVDLFQVMSNARLQGQHWKFTNWTLGAEAAICDHICNYVSKVEKSCKRLKWWFLVHNISLILFVPLVVIGNLNLIALTDGQFVLSAIPEITDILLVWALPLYFAERIEKHDKSFFCMVNNFYPEQLLSAKRDPQATGILTMESVPIENEENIQNLTFIYRAEVQLLVDYLKSIRSGFKSVGYTFQLKLSLISTIISLTVLIFKIINRRIAL